MAAMHRLPCLLRTSSRSLGSIRKPLIQIPALRTFATKHPKDFVAPTEEDLLELRERVQEFTSAFPLTLVLWALL